MNISILIAQEEHFKYAEIICDTIESSAKLRGTGIAKRTSYHCIIIDLIKNQTYQFILVATSSIV